MSGGSPSGTGGTGLEPGVCGDGMYGIFEQCDDGNTVSGDGCSSQCQVEPNFACGDAGTPCRPVVCGDGQQQGYPTADGGWAFEGCDDGNKASGDGCSASCNLESGWICDQPGIACRQPVCGDSKQDSWFVAGPGGVGGATSGSGGGSGGGGSSGTFYYEECDDGNAASGDGCSSACTVETGWICQQPGVACHQPTCGDGIVDFIAGSGSGGSGGYGGYVGGGGGPGSGGYWEACDDGNKTNGDGCDASCAVEPGWSCNSWDGACHVIVCGDGFADYPTEQCDDGNSVPNDGCTHCIWDNQGWGGSGSGGVASGGAASGGMFTGGTSAVVAGGGTGGKF